MDRLLAVDVALLPPPEIMETVIDLINYDKDSAIQLNQQDCLPHITLAMGIMKETDIDKVKQVLENLLGDFQPLDLEIRHTQTKKITDGKLIGDAEVEYNELLTKLHLDIMRALRPYLSHDSVHTNMFASPPNVAEISTSWVQHYFDNQTPEGFRPHITLGEGEIKQPEKLIKFTATRLALCHLGSYCTCRKVLAELTLV